MTKLHAVGFEPTRITTPELESGPLDRSGMHADNDGVRTRAQINAEDISRIS